MSYLASNAPAYDAAIARMERRNAARDALSIPRHPIVEDDDEMDAPADWNSGSVTFDPFVG